MSTVPDPIELSRALIRCPSVTPADAGALDVLGQALEPLGFACERLRFEEHGTVLDFIADDAVAAIKAAIEQSRNK